jgi:uncharacterized protein YkwD
VHLAAALLDPVQGLRKSQAGSSMMKLKLSCLMAFGALAALAGCGGGSDDSSTVAPQAESAAPAPPSASAPAPTISTAGTRATCNLVNFEAEVLALVNAYRAAGASCGSEGTFPGVAPLAWNASLTQSSLGHSDDMVASNFFSHTGSDGSNAGQRATAAGYVWQSIGENIAAGQDSVEIVMAAWMASPGHCANIMQERFRDIGLACVSGGAVNTYRSYWTMTLGLAR